MAPPAYGTARYLQFGPLASLRLAVLLARARARRIWTVECQVQRLVQNRSRTFGVAEVAERFGKRPHTRVGVAAAQGFASKREHMLLELFRPIQVVLGRHGEKGSRSPLPNRADIDIGTKPPRRQT
jgi:hypothetical protein